MAKLQTGGVGMVVGLMLLAAAQVSAETLDRNTPYVLAVDPRNIEVKRTIWGEEYVHKVQLQAITVDAATRTHRIPVDNIAIWYVANEENGPREDGKKHCPNAEYCEVTLKSFPIPVRVYCWHAYVRDRRGDQVIRIGQCPSDYYSR